MVRWQFALASSAVWWSLACTAAVGEAPAPEVPESEVALAADRRRVHPAECLAPGTDST